MASFNYLLSEPPKIDTGFPHVSIHKPSFPHLIRESGRRGVLAGAPARLCYPRTRVCLPNPGLSRRMHESIIWQTKRLSIIWQLMLEPRTP